LIFPWATLPANAELNRTRRATRRIDFPAVA
jgi:hypothetical protein